MKQEFQNGTIYWHPRTGAFEVHGAIRAHWLALGGEQSPFGYPISDETSTPDGAGRFNHFEHASIYWHSSTGAFEIHGLIRARWQAMGSEQSILGYPVTDETATPDGIGRYNHFQNGSIYWTPATGAVEVYGPIRERWAELRWERGLLGYPTRSPYNDVRGRDTFLVATFQGGTIDLNNNTRHVHTEKFATVSSPNYRVPITAYRVSDTDGARPCAITADGVRQWVDEANRVYAAAGVQFTFDGNLLELRDTEVNNMRGEADPWWPAARDRLNALAAQHRSVVVVHRFGPGTSSIGGGFSWWTYDFVAMSFFDPNALGVLPHELGHHFGLPHTHGMEFATVQEAVDYMLSGRPADAIDGDRSVIDDTQVDPFIRELQFATAVGAVALGGRSFSLARKNIMSYWDHGGTGQLTHSQIDRVRQLVVERRSRYLNVTVIMPVDCVALTNQIARLHTRLAELIAERDAEPDPLLRRRYYAAIARLRSEINRVTTQARQAGCI